MMTVWQLVAYLSIAGLSVVLAMYWAYFRNLVNTRFQAMRLKKKGYVLATILHKTGHVSRHLVKPNTEGFFTIRRKVGEKTEEVQYRVNRQYAVYDPDFDIFSYYYYEDQKDPIPPIPNAKAAIDSRYVNLLVTSAYAAGKSDSIHVIEEIAKNLRNVVYLLIVAILAIVALAAFVYLMLNNAGLMGGAAAGAKVAAKVVEANAAKGVVV